MDYQLILTMNQRLLTWTLWKHQSPFPAPVPIPIARPIKLNSSRKPGIEDKRSFSGRSRKDISGLEGRMGGREQCGDSNKMPK